MPESSLNGNLLPGISAATWRRVFNVTAGIGAIPFVFLMVQMVFRVDSVLPGALAAYIVTVALVTVVLIVANRRAVREASAGYTTLARAYSELDQRDPRSGVVLRRAGDEYLHNSFWRRMAGIPARPTAEAPAAPSPALLLLPSVFGWAVGLLLIGFFSVNLTRGNPHPLTFPIVAMVTYTIVFTVAMVAGARVRRARLAALGALAPGAYVFLFSDSKAFSAAADALAGEHLSVRGLAAPKRGPMGASTDASGLTLWAGAPFSKVLDVPWTKVASLQLDRTAAGNSSSPSVLITYRQDDDQLAPLQLRAANDGLLPTTSSAAPRWVASELNRRRLSTRETGPSS